MNKRITCIGWRGTEALLLMTRIMYFCSFTCCWGHCINLNYGFDFFFCWLSVSFYFWDSILLHSPVRPGTHSVAQDTLKFIATPASVTHILIFLTLTQLLAFYLGCYNTLNVMPQNWHSMHGRLLYIEYEWSMSLPEQNKWAIHYVKCIYFCHSLHGDRCCKDYRNINLIGILSSQ